MATQEVLQQLNNISCGGRCAVGSGGAAVGSPRVLGIRACTSPSSGTASIFTTHWAVWECSAMSLRPANCRT